MFWVGSSRGFLLILLTLFVHGDFRLIDSVFGFSFFDRERKGERLTKESKQKQWMNQWRLQGIGVICVPK